MGVYLVALVVIVAQCHWQVAANYNDVLYNSIFRYSSEQMAPRVVGEALDRLASDPQGFPVNDPRRYEVHFWRQIRLQDESKCRRSYDDMLLERLQSATEAAEQSLALQQYSEQNTILNLETFVMDARIRILLYCEAEVGVPFVKALRDVTKGDHFEQFFDLTVTSRHPERINEHRMGQAVGDVILRLSDDADYELISQLFDAELVQQEFKKHSPCEAVLGVVQQYEEYYGLITATGNYQRAWWSDIRRWIDRIRVCQFIDENEEVFEIANEYLLDKDRRPKATRRLSEAQMTNRDKYNSIFRFSEQQLTLPDVQVTLLALDSYRRGLAIDDTRREDVSFWLRLTLHDESICNRRADDELISHMAHYRARAMEASASERQHRSEHTDRYLNLEVFFEHVRSERLVFCDTVVGNRLVRELDQLDPADLEQLQALTVGFRYGQEVDTVELGKRVRAVIESSNSSRDVERSRTAHGQHSPWRAVLDIAGRYEDYYGLVTSPAVYDALRPPLRSWIDKIWVCKLIEGSPQVLEGQGMATSG